MKIAVQITTDVGMGYRACCPSLPGCVAFGHSPQEARDRVGRAILGYLASLDVPAPMKLDLEVPEHASPSRRAEPPALQFGGAA